MKVMDLTSAPVFTDGVVVIPATWTVLPVVPAVVVPPGVPGVPPVVVPAVVVPAVVVPSVVVPPVVVPEVVIPPSSVLSVSHPS